MRVACLRWLRCDQFVYGFTRSYSNENIGFLKGAASAQFLPSPGRGNNPSSPPTAKPSVERGQEVRRTAGVDGATLSGNTETFSYAARPPTSWHA